VCRQWPVVVEAELFVLDHPDVVVEGITEDDLRLSGRIWKFFGG
jgi:hypothetical protein